MSEQGGPRDAAQPVNKIDDKVVDATLNAYYPALIASADAARARAQVAYTIASATAAALVAAGVLTNIAAAPFWVRLLGTASLIAWITVAALFMFVVMRVRPQRKKSRSPSDGPAAASEPGAPQKLGPNEFVD